MDLSLHGGGEVGGVDHARPLAEDSIVFQVRVNPRHVVRRVGGQRPDPWPGLTPTASERFRTAFRTPKDGNLRTG